MQIKKINQILLSSLIIVVLLNPFGAFSAANTIPVSYAMDIRIPIHQSHLVPAICVGTIYTNVIQGSGNIQGTSGNDLIFGSDGYDNISGGGGNDCILAGGGWLDIINGDAGDDVIDGGSGFDIISGGDGIDTCYNGEWVGSCEFIW